MLKTSNMQSVIVSNRFIIGIISFGISFGLTLVFSWDLNEAFFTGLITVLATYLSALFIDKRRRNHEMLVLDSLQKRIRELESLKSLFTVEVNQLETHKSSLYTESNQLQNQVVERRNQRESLNRELGAYVIERKQLEADIKYLQNELHEVEKVKLELNTSISALTSEKRRLELNTNISRSEITQLQTQISELQKQKEELESNLTLLDRIKPQLEEKLYELRVKIQDLEVQGTQQKKLILNQKAEKEITEANLNSLQTQLVEKESHLQQLQEQVVLLQEERDQLQNQIWDFLYQIETLTTQEQLKEDKLEDIDDFFPFAELVDSLDSEDITEEQENFSEEWHQFFEQLHSYEIQVLKALLEPNNSNTAIKKIAEENITMPTILIDSINGRANDTIGELIIDTSSEYPEIYEEYINHVKKVIATYEVKIADRISSK